MKCEAKTEQELREHNVPWPKTEKELMEYINSLVKRDHDYGTCVYAMSCAALATFYYVSNKLGVTGFQASCADMDFLKRSRGMKNGFRILDYDKLLYPQFLNKDNFPSISDLVYENKEHLSKVAKELLKNETACPEVRKRWEEIARLK